MVSALPRCVVLILLLVILDHRHIDIVSLVNRLYIVMVLKWHDLEQTYQYFKLLTLSS